MEGPTQVSERPGPAGGQGGPSPLASRAGDELPDLLYSDAERALSDALASLLADRGGVEATLART